MALQDFGFVGATYQSRSVIADAERCINLYPEQVESGQGKNQYVLVPTPGLRPIFTPAAPGGSSLPTTAEVWIENKTFSVQLPPSPITGAQSSNMVTLLVSWNQANLGVYVYYLFGIAAPALLPAPGVTLPSTAPSIPLSGAGLTANMPVSSCYFASNGRQAILALGYPTGTQYIPTTTLYIADLTKLGSSGSACTFSPIASWNNNLSNNQITGLEFLDSYFILSTPSVFYVSAVNDPTTWSALSFATENDEPDGIVTVKQFQRQLWFFGQTRIEAYYDAGNADFPMQRIPNGVVETGCASGPSIVHLDGALFWLGTDDHGTLGVFRSNGYAAVRVSNHAVETQIQNTLKLSSPAIMYASNDLRYANTYLLAPRAYGYSENGHQFYVLNFPSPAPVALNGTRTYAVNPPPPITTLVYDCATQQWHERQYSPDAVGFSRHLGQLYSYNPTVCGHVLTDYSSATAFQVSPDSTADGPQYLLSAAGTIVRVRTARHLSTANSLNFYKRFLLDYDLGSQYFPSSSGGPPILLQWSNDGGRTFNAGVSYIPPSDPNSYSTVTNTFRALWRRLGKSRDRVFKVTVVGQITLINAFVDIDGGQA